MKLQIQRIIISLQVSFCIMLTLTAGDDLKNRNNFNNITYQCGTQSTSSILRPIVERVFSRKKRFLLVPPGGSLKFTANIGKRILSAYPRGFAFVFEAASYYEGFAKPSDLIPKWLRAPTTTTPMPKEPTTPIYVYIPGIGLRYKARPAIRPQKVQRIDSDDAALQWVDDSNKIDFTDPTNWRHQYAKYDRSDYPVEYYDWTPSVAKTQQQWWPPMEENEIYQEPLSYAYDREVYTPPSLHHYHGHRDRRQLFEKFETFSKILGYDMKACIMRAICECKILLLPPGYSMLQDMMRVILTMPVHQSTSDEYTAEAMRDSAENCEQQFHHECPISFLNWILNPMKSVRK